MSTRLFGRDAAVVVLAAFALIEAASIIGISPSLASIFTYPVSLIVSSVLTISSARGLLSSVESISARPVVALRHE